MAPYSLYWPAEDTYPVHVTASINWVDSTVHHILTSTSAPKANLKFPPQLARMWNMKSCVKYAIILILKTPYNDKKKKTIIIGEEW